MIDDERRRSGPRARLDASLSLRSWEGPTPLEEARLPRNVSVQCGWGRLIFGHTYRCKRELAAELLREAPGQRDIAVYLRDPHVVVSLAPQELFLDPSYTYRLWLEAWPKGADSAGAALRIRPLRTVADLDAVNRIYRAHHMAALDPAIVMGQLGGDVLSHLVAEEASSGAIVGSVTGVDHVAAYGDPEGGASLWSLAVAADSGTPGIGQGLVRALLDHYAARGRVYLDLSVLHDNESAIALYEKLGFGRVPVFCLKRKNPLNEPLYTGPAPEEQLNPYAAIIVDEARRRGVRVEVLDASTNLIALTHGGRTVRCRESLSTLTSAVAMTLCEDKRLTHAIARSAGLRVPDQREAGDEVEDLAFLARHGRVVVKPGRGEQGRGISMDITAAGALCAAIERAAAEGGPVLLEEQVRGADLRVLVIGGAVVAAATRRPPIVVGTGRHTVRELVRRLSRRRMAATGGESRVPEDEETRRCIASAGHGWDSVLAEGEALTVRRTANLHTGGTIHDVTADLHPAIEDAAVRCAAALEIPVVGLDFIVPRVEGPGYTLIEANERPGLANHEPQPTAARFVDLLFPETARKDEIT